MPEATVGPQNHRQSIGIRETDVEGTGNWAVL